MPCRTFSIFNFYRLGRIFFGVGRSKLKKKGFLLFFVGGIFITSADLPCPESTDHGLIVKDNFTSLEDSSTIEYNANALICFFSPRMYHEKHISGQQKKKKNLNCIIHLDFFTTILPIVFFFFVCRKPFMCTSTRMWLHLAGVKMTLWCLSWKKQNQAQESRPIELSGTSSQ